MVDPKPPSYSWNKYIKGHTLMSVLTCHYKTSFRVLTGPFTQKLQANAYCLGHPDYKNVCLRRASVAHITLSIDKQTHRMFFFISIDWTVNIPKGTETTITNLHSYQFFAMCNKAFIVIVLSKDEKDCGNLYRCTFQRLWYADKEKALSCNIYMFVLTM